VSFCDHDTGCITCGDVAMALTVLRVDEERELALCATDDGQKETVETALVGRARPGDVLLVHAGTALQRLEAPA
jgi:hydrogenase maturation factor